MTTAERLMRYPSRINVGGYSHGAKAIDRGSQEAIAGRATAAGRQVEAALTVDAGQLAVRAAIL